MGDDKKCGYYGEITSKSKVAKPTDPTKKEEKEDCVTDKKDHQRSVDIPFVVVHEREEDKATHGKLFCDFSTRILFAKPTNSFYQTILIFHPYSFSQTNPLPILFKPKTTPDPIPIYRPFPFIEVFIPAHTQTHYNKYSPT